MKITRIRIKNYKSISSLDIQTNGRLNVFIGENSVGKSNIFDAINWLLGPVYPSFNSTLPNDHYQGDLENKIRIRLYFDDGNFLELAEEWIDKYDNPKSGLNLTGEYVTDITRQKYCSAYLGIDRQILDYLPSNRWSLMGRILQEINAAFCKEKVVDEETGEEIYKSDLLKSQLRDIRDNTLFSVRDDEGNEVMKNFIELLQKESAKQLNKPEQEFSVDFNLYDPWNFYRTLQLLVKDSESTLEFQASKLGMGVQASISIAVLKAYSTLKLKNNTPIFIDEPELFLHPQAQRNFHKLLNELADNGTQIFLTTHSPNFLNLARFEEIYVVRKEATTGTYINCAACSDFITDLYQRHQIVSDYEAMMLQYMNAYEHTGDTQKANEAFFAKAIILVEGESESLILPHLFDIMKFDYLSKGITIVRCGGKNELDRFYRLYSEFGIPCFLMFDGDDNHIGTQEERPTIKKNRALLKLFGIEADFPDGNVHDSLLGFKSTFDVSLGLGTTSKGLKLFRLAKEKIISIEQMPSWAPTLAGKLDALTKIKASSVLVREQQIA
ncbi:DUF2813 domain-containing protein [Rufibacter immobilis]|uniref:DUF2813 domain-containing protein n=1 Tax=Rufibacter immobilis TaxID=1348778 RepID=A0A3M9N3T4_9BACT|nr:AAA family ATPase [Rufibacter immobilis]RNI32454.1 DUF2813 domain-containing protein [Rufibacter immobilis]